MKSANLAVALIAVVASGAKLENTSEQSETGIEYFKRFDSTDATSRGAVVSKTSSDDPWKLRAGYDNLTDGSNVQKRRLDFSETKKKSQRNEDQTPKYLKDRKQQENNTTL